MKQLLDWMQREKQWVIPMVIGGLLLFWIGVRYIHSVNREANLPIKPLVLPVSSAPAEPVKESLQDLKLSRDRERSREMEKVQQVLEKVGLSDAVRKEAEAELWHLTQAGCKEADLENLLQAKGFPDVLVTMHPKLVTVVVTGKLFPEQARLIGELTAEVTGYPTDQVQIVER